MPYVGEQALGIQSADAAGLFIFEFDELRIACFAVWQWPAERRMKAEACGQRSPCPYCARWLSMANASGACKTETTRRVRNEGIDIAGLRHPESGGTMASCALLLDHFTVKRRCPGEAMTRQRVTLTRHRIVDRCSVRRRWETGWVRGHSIRRGRHSTADRVAVASRSTESCAPCGSISAVKVVD